MLTSYIGSQLGNPEALPCLKTTLKNADLKKEALENFSITTALKVLYPDFNRYQEISKILLEVGTNKEYLENVCVIVLRDPIFAPLSGLDGVLVLVNNKRMFVPKDAKLAGTDLSQVNDTFAVLKPEYRKKFMQGRVVSLKKEELQSA